MSDHQKYNLDQAQEMLKRMNDHFASSDNLLKSRQANRSRTQDKAARYIMQELGDMGVKLTHNAMGFFQITTKGE
jgi:hypothetical protein